jgi:hypothetical protein
MVTVHIGDWVRFFHNGRLVIGVVQYLRPRSSWQSHDTAITDAGEVSVNYILEAR